MPAIWKGGPGHRAPYKTTHVRVPEPIKDQVQKMIDDYKRQALAGQPATMPPDPSDSPTKNDLEAAIEILLECFPMAPNKGGAIKNQVRKAIAILDPGNPESELRPITTPRRSAKARSAKRPFKPL